MRSGSGTSDVRRTVDCVGGGGAHCRSQKCGARTLFATHYHELSETGGHAAPAWSNYRITAKEQGEDVIFLRKIVPGGADRSYGVAVAQAGGASEEA